MQWVLSTLILALIFAALLVTLVWVTRRIVEAVETATIASSRAVGESVRIALGLESGPPPVQPPDLITSPDVEVWSPSFEWDEEELNREATVGLRWPLVDVPVPPGEGPGEEL